ncbi:MAG TPA: mechanosensitive ion channel domain-containing protein [Pseudomonadales bacterium]
MIAAATIVCVAWLLGYVIRRLLQKHLEANDTDVGSRLYVAGRISTYLIYTIAFFMMLSALGINTSQLAMVLGALSVGIGFGLQSIVNNFISGIIILLERNLKVGDYLQLDSGLIGRVKEINIRSTRINTTDNLDIMVPNSEFVGGRYFSGRKAVGIVVSGSARRVDYGLSNE